MRIDDPYMNYALAHGYEIETITFPYAYLKINGHQFTDLMPLMTCARQLALIGAAIMSDDPRRNDPGIEIVYEEGD